MRKMPAKVEFQSLETVIAFSGQFRGGFSALKMNLKLSEKRLPITCLKRLNKGMRKDGRILLLQAGNWFQT
jgi:hypothetical protein